MENINNFIYEFLRLPEEYNKLAEKGNTFSYTRVHYSAMVSYPHGSNNIREKLVPAYHFCLTIIFEPMGESVAVENNIVCFYVTGGKIKSIIFEKYGEREDRGSMDLGDESIRVLLDEIKKFCKAALPVDENETINTF